MDSHYVGGELELFASARNWKAYWHKQVAPFFGETVLDIGAGAGATAEQCCGPAQRRWLAVEPDRALAAQIEQKVHAGQLPNSCEVLSGTIDDVPALPVFSSVLYIDVLEHIEDDCDQVEAAYARLAPGGHLVVLSPAHQYLFTAFDRSIGHYRRYSTGSLAALGPEGAKLVRLRYLDSVGVFASLANRFLLKQSMPTASQIATWDGLMVPLSRVLDPLLGYTVGKSALAIWQKPLAR